MSGIVLWGRADYVSCFANWAFFMRFLCVLISFVMLCLGIVLAVLDATRSIAAGTWVFTPLGDTWRGALPDLFLTVETSLKASGVPILWDLFSLVILDPPGWVVFGVLAFLFHAIGWRRKRPNNFGHLYR